ncbi:uncharacterized protein GIQ15_00139 [Arthroderma uncinatum]|uniref:uncharacterized protein n=1 Tax=Arthroderma uncinatum TaxID=74035 RepID=UPI00144AF2FC|nr:uncharacterized protein GIQ15_00139 [Arthroderma uncinatum]KAF3490622.1 hypothetical protein GIQ15_00139 [Arthroderma uncinatum]
MSSKSQVEMVDVESLIPNLGHAPYPGSTKQAAGVVGGQPTDVMAISFQDKILVTVTQNGRLAQWLHVPLDISGPTGGFNTLANQEDGLLPRPEFNATPLLGGRSGDWEVVGQLYACQIATAIAAKSPDEKRLLVVGLGLETADVDRDIYLGIVDLVLECL